MHISNGIPYFARSGHGITTKTWKVPTLQWEPSTKTRQKRARPIQAYGVTGNSATPSRNPLPFTFSTAFPGVSPA